jgi:hypothetical protein
MDDGKIKPDRPWQPDPRTHKPAIPYHPDPSEPGFQRPSTGRREDDAEPFPEHRPAVPFHPDPGPQP